MAVKVFLKGVTVFVDDGKDIKRIPSGYTNYEIKRSLVFIHNLIDSSSKSFHTQDLRDEKGNTVSDPDEYLSKFIGSFKNGGADGEGSDNGFPNPYFVSISPKRLNHNVTKDLTIKGSFFTPNTQVEIENQTVNSVTFVSDNELIVNVTTNDQDGFYDVTISNGSKSTISENVFEVKLSEWIDLSSSGDTFQSGDIRFRGSMQINRDANGMYFTGLNPWQTWVKFDFLKWNRGEGKTLQWVFSRNTSYMMIGIGSNETNENNNAQYAQMEVQAYLNSATNFWGLYGNNGSPGSAGNQYNNYNTGSESGFFKIKFQNDGGSGARFTLYALPSGDPSDWDDETKVLKDFNIGGSLNPNASVIMPCIVPQNGGSQRFLALKLE